MNVKWLAGICLICFMLFAITSCALMKEFKDDYSIEKALDHYGICKKKMCPNLDMDKSRKENEHEMDN